MTGERLSGLDGAFVALESPTTHLHVVGVLVLEPGAGAPEATFRRIRDHVASRLGGVPPFRQRLAGVPLGLAPPALVDAPSVDLDFHVRRLALPRPGGRGELEAAVAEVASRPLDRRRPLWEMHVVEGLADGGTAVVVKLHHAIVDGVAGAGLLATFLDLEPDPGSAPVTSLDSRRKVADPAPEGADESRPPGPTGPGVDLEPWLSLLGSVPGQLDAAVRSIGRTARRLRAMAARRTGAEATPLPLSAPRTPINRSISPQRRVATADLDSAAVRRVRQVFGGTANDVVLAAVTGSLRQLLLGRSALPEEALVALVPVSVRVEADHDALGNRLSAMLVSLPSHVGDPCERLDLIRSSAAAAKSLERQGGAELLQGWAEAMAPAVTGRASRLATDSRLFDRLRPLFNVVVSNVPGPSEPLFLAGTRLRAAIPFGPIVEGVGLNITVLSYLDRIHVGVMGCWDLLPDVDLVARGIEDSVAELARLADRRDRPVPWWHAEVVPA